MTAKKQPAKRKPTKKAPARRPAVRQQLPAARKALKALDLEDHAGAIGALVEGLAARVDRSPSDVEFWREYRQALKLLLDLPRDEDEDDGETALLELVRTSVGHTEDARPADAGAGAGSGS